jgi:hypothetical protein
VCNALVDLAQLEHYLLRIDHRCRLVFARRTTAPFDQVRQIRACFAEIERLLADVPRSNYNLLVDARQGPSRNDGGFETVLQEVRGKLLLGFARNAALAATAAGRLQIQRYARQDGRDVLSTDNPLDAFEYLGLCPHRV